MEVRDALKQMGSGEVLEVITDYKPAATESIPNFCKKKGYPIEAEEKDGIWELIITKKE
jgi:TusA-related sulfurtransferase